MGLADGLEGLMVGGAVGLDGLAVGGNVGALEVGLLVGDVGLAVGFMVGPVCFTVGIAVGQVGMNDGIVVGDLEGLKLGAEDASQCFVNRSTAVVIRAQTILMRFCLLLKNYRMTKTIVCQRL